MRFKIIYLTAVVCITIAQPLFAQMPVYDNSHTAIILSKQNPFFMIAFEFDPSNGADWNLHAYDSRLLSLVKYDFKPYTHEPRSKGIISWTFKAYPAAFTENQTTSIIIDYGYHWSTDHKLKVLNYSVTVGPKSIF